MAYVDKLHSSILWHLLYKRFFDKQTLARRKEYLVGLDLISETSHGGGGSSESGKYIGMIQNTL